MLKNSAVGNYLFVLQFFSMFIFFLFYFFVMTFAVEFFIDTPTDPNNVFGKFFSHFFCLLFLYRRKVEDLLKVNDE